MLYLQSALDVVEVVRPHNDQHVNDARGITPNSLPIESDQSIPHLHQLDAEFVRCCPEERQGDVTRSLVKRAFRFGEGISPRFFLGWSLPEMVCKPSWIYKRSKPFFHLQLKEGFLMQEELSTMCFDFMLRPAAAFCRLAHKQPERYYVEEFEFFTVIVTFSLASLRRVRDRLLRRGGAIVQCTNFLN